VTDSIPLGCLLVLPIHTVNCVQTPKANEFYIDKAGKIYYWPAVPLAEWTSAPTVSDGMVAVKLDGTSHVTLDSVTVAHAKATGISAVGVTAVEVKNNTVFGCGSVRVFNHGFCRVGVSPSCPPRVRCAFSTMDSAVLGLAPAAHYGYGARFQPWILPCWG
jgi:hypothetical protein